MEETTSSARIIQTKKAKLKARAISVDSDTPEADKTDQARNSGDTRNVISGEFDEVFYFFSDAK